MHIKQEQCYWENKINTVFVKFAPKFKSASRSKSWSLCFDFNAEFTFIQLFLKKQNGTYITSKHPNYVINQKGNVLLQVRRHFAFKVIRVLATLSQVIFSVVLSGFPRPCIFCRICTPEPCNKLFAHVIMARDATTFLFYFMLTPFFRLRFGIN